MNNRRKILYIITKSAWGGATKYTYDLASAMPQNGFETHVAAGLPAVQAGPAFPEEKNLFAELQNSHARCHAIKNFQKSINPFKDIFALWEILRLIRKIKPDIIHASSSKASGLTGLATFILKILSPKTYNPKTIFTAHGWAYHESRPKWQREAIKWLSRATAFFYETVITVSEFDRQSAIQNKIGRPEKFLTVHNGMDPASLVFLAKNEARAALMPLIEQKSLWIGAIGEFTANKGHKFLIEAAKILCPKYPELRFAIIGHRGEEKSNLLRQITEYGLSERVRIIDSPPDAAKYLKAFDVFILPSLKEGLPYVLLEAGLAELPVVATDVGGNKEIIENMQNGLLIPPKNPEAIAESIKKLLDDELLRKKLSSSLRQKILRDFSLSKMINETLAIYRQ